MNAIRNALGRGDSKPSKTSSTNSGGLTKPSNPSASKSTATASKKTTGTSKNMTVTKGSNVAARTAPIPAKNKTVGSSPIKKKTTAGSTTTAKKPPSQSPTSEKSKGLYAKVPASKWIFSQHKFAGSFSYDTIGRQELVSGKSIEKAVQDFKKNPAKYIAIMYQADLESWPVDQQSFTYIHREGTVLFKPQGTSPKGWMTIMIQDYQHLPPFPNDQLPKANRDKYTDAMVHHKRKLHSNNKNPPILPGRGMGVGDTPLLKLIGDIDPSDIHQGQVGDCWLLSAISALAEFDGAIKKLFRKTKNIDRRPLEGPNQYILTLWDLPTWKEVDIVVDERLAVAPDGKLLASRPSVDGELWVCYLEKALASHCGGWDKITGGQCSHAWSLMTGCREQYTIRRNPKTGKFGCYAKYNPREGKWAPHKNCPQENNSDMWRVPWPKVGGGGGADVELTENEVFEKMYAFDQTNFIVAAGTNGTSDKNLTDGMVDNHAYSVIECVNDAAGTDIDLFKVRNPWGKGEIENGEFDDDGPGWDRYPQIKKELNPVVADDGIFYLTKQEFFRLFDHIYVSASNMTKFLED